MSRPSCAGSTIDPHCERNVMRYRDGHGYCMWHPGEEPPAVDPKTGRPIAAKPANAAPRPKHLELAPAPDDLPELQAELVELEATDPVVAAAAASYDATVDRILTRDPETPTEGKANDHATEQGEVSRQAAAPQAHDGADSHDVGPVTCEAEPAPEKGGQGEQPTLPAPPPPDPYWLGMRITAEHCQPPRDRPHRRARRPLHRAARRRRPHRAHRAHPARRVRRTTNHAGWNEFASAEEAAKDHARRPPGDARQRRPHARPSSCQARRRPRHAMTRARDPKSPTPQADWTHMTRTTIDLFAGIGGIG